APETTRGCHGLDGTRRATGGAAASRVDGGVVSVVVGSGGAGRERALATRLSATIRRACAASPLVRRIALAGAERTSGAGTGEACGSGAIASSCTDRAGGKGTVALG